MKPKFIIALLLLSSLATAQVQFTSKNNAVTSWEDNSTWTKSPNESWVANNPGSNLNWNALFIYGFVTRHGNITNMGSTTIYVRDTLVISGNLNNQAGGKIIVENGGVLVVVGNYSNSGGATITSTGTGRIAVTGEFSHSNGTVTMDNQFYLFDDTPTFSGGSFVNGTQYTNHPPPNGNTSTLAGYFSDEADLQTEDLSFYNFVMGLMTPLPIRLLSFTAKTEGSIVKLDWATATEDNFWKFIVERANDGLVFAPLYEIEGHGNSHTVQRYAFVDEAPMMGRNYYRLKQIDYDGFTEYSPLITAVSESGPYVSVYPNPVSDNTLRFAMNFAPGDSDVIRIIHIGTGREIVRKATEIKDGALSVDQASGIYILKYQAHGYTENLRLIVK